MQEQVGTAAHLHGNQTTDAPTFTSKVLPLQLPAYHPFSRL